MNKEETTLLSVEPIDAGTWRVNCSVSMGNGQRIDINLLMAAAPQMTVQQLEQAVFREVAQRLVRRIQG